MVTKDERPSASRVVEGNGRQRRLVHFGLGRPPGWAGLGFAVLCCALLLLQLLLLLLVTAALGRTQAGWRLEQ